MDKKELKLILNEGEGYKTEFKESFVNIDREFVAFANSSGGRIFLGITDNRKIKGIQIANRLKSQLQDIANNCKPSVQIFLEEFKNILIINVREGDDKPYSCSSGFFKRVGPNSQKMTRNELIESFKSEGKIKFDEFKVSKFSYPKDFDKNRFVKFLELAQLSKTTKPKIILGTLGVTERQEGKFCFNNAGILFFAKEPQRFIPWSVFTVVLFKDKEGVGVIDRKEITGGLFEIVEQVMDFVRLYSKVAYKFSGKPQREEIYEYPFEAIREAVINSVMHKDYFEHGHNNILKFYPDKIQIENIWVKPKNFVLGKTVFRRNQIIADLFSRIHFGEKLGTGMNRMKVICKAEDAPYPKIEFTDIHFYIVFNQNREYLKMAEKKEAKQKSDVDLSGRQKKAIEYIKEKGRITNREYRKLCNIGRDTAHRDLQSLVDNGILKREGAGRSAYYRMIIG